MHTALFTTLSFLGITVTACTKVGMTTHTFYGYPDNDPPGPATAYDCGRSFEAGGTGTYADPLTFASAPGEFDQCEIIYDPYTRKYLRFEDTCAQCTTDWEASPRINHIDVWTGSPTNNGGQEQIECENELTPGDRSQTIVRQPAEDLPVDCEYCRLGEGIVGRVNNVLATALYAQGESPACRISHVYPDYNVDDFC